MYDKVIGMGSNGDSRTESRMGRYSVDSHESENSAITVPSCRQNTQPQGLPAGSCGFLVFPLKPQHSWTHPNEVGWNFPMLVNNCKRVSDLKAPIVTAKFPVKIVITPLQSWPKPNSESLWALETLTLCFLRDTPHPSMFIQTSVIGCSSLY